MSARKLLRKVLGDTAGTSAVEYGLILSFVVLAMMTALNLIAERTISMWDVVSDKVTNTP
jgi:pilus assembly protein Flp/PilA